MLSRVIPPDTREPLEPTVGETVHLHAPEIALGDHVADDVPVVVGDGAVHGDAVLLHAIDGRLAGRGVNGRRAVHGGREVAPRGASHLPRHEVSCVR